MPLYKDGEVIHTSHASKQSKISFKLFEVHTAVLVPLLALPLAPTLTTLKYASLTILGLILLERRGWTLKVALKRMRARLAGRFRMAKTRSRLVKRMRDY